MRSGTSLYSFCLAVVLGLASAAHAATYNVTLLEGPDQPGTGDYTLAGAVAAANLDAEPAEVLIHVPVSVLQAPLELTNTVTIAAADADITAWVYPLEGVETAIIVGASASGSRLENIYLVYDGPAGEGTAIGLCDTQMVIQGGIIGRFGKALELQCGAVDLTVEDTSFEINMLALEGELLAGSQLNLVGISARRSGGLIDLHAPECGGELVLDGAQIGSRFDEPVLDSITLAGCVELTVRDTVFSNGLSFLRAGPLPSEDDSLVPRVLLDQVVVTAHAEGSGPLIHFDGDRLELRHSTVAQNRTAGNECMTISSGEMHLDHTVIADNGCQFIALEGNANLEYSLVDPEWLGGSVARDAASLALLGQVVRLEGQPPAPAPDSLLREAGDPLRTPGVGDTPLTDVRGSARLTGAVIDIGAVEFNRLPEFDRREFIASIRAARKSWRQRGLGPDDPVAFMLEEFISDPDGDTYIIHDAVAVVGGSEIEIWATGPIFMPLISGPQSLFLNGMLMAVDVEDEKGLRGFIVVEVPPVRADSGAAFWMLLPLVLLLGRRRRAL